MISSRLISFLNKKPPENQTWPVHKLFNFPEVSPYDKNLLLAAVSRPMFVFINTNLCMAKQSTTSTTLASNTAKFTYNPRRSLGTLIFLTLLQCLMLYYIPLPPCQCCLLVKKTLSFQSSRLFWGDMGVIRNN